MTPLSSASAACEEHTNNNDDENEQQDHSSATLAAATMTPPSQTKKIKTKGRSWDATLDMLHRWVDSLADGENANGDGDVMVGVHRRRRRLVNLIRMVLKDMLQSRAPAEVVEEVFKLGERVGPSLLRQVLSGVYEEEPLSGANDQHDLGIHNHYEYEHGRHWLRHAMDANVQVNVFDVLVRIMVEVLPATCIYQNFRELDWWTMSPVYLDVLLSVCGPIRPLPASSSCFVEEVHHHHHPMSTCWEVDFLKEAIYGRKAELDTLSDHDADGHTGTRTRRILQAWSAAAVASSSTINDNNNKDNDDDDDNFAVMSTLVDFLLHHEVRNVAWWVDEMRLEGLLQTLDLPESTWRHSDFIALHLALGSRSTDLQQSSDDGATRRLLQTLSLLRNWIWNRASHAVADRDENDLRYKRSFIAKLLFDMAPQTAQLADPVTRMYPFQLAAVTTTTESSKPIQSKPRPLVRLAPRTNNKNKQGDPMDLTYQLLRAGPSVLKQYHD